MMGAVDAVPAAAGTCERTVPASSWYLREQVQEAAKQVVNMDHHLGSTLVDEQARDTLGFNESVFSHRAA